MRRIVAAAIAAALVLGCAGCPPHYDTCESVKSAGKAPLHRGDPGYSSDLDRDGDGTACEE